MRVTAFVALNGRSVDRRHAAGTLWPSCGDERAAANLRSTLWRLARGPDRLLDVTARHVHLAEDVAIDVDLVECWAADAAAAMPPMPASVDLMPGNSEPWVVVHRERIRQRVLHVLEQRSAELLAVGLIDEASALASQALRFDPVRESAVRSVMACQLARGDHREARATFTRYCARLDGVLGVGPGSQLDRLLAAAVPAPRSHRPVYQHT
jgi:DNA-binding SARP family transcriptional activator